MKFTFLTSLGDLVPEVTLAQNRQWLIYPRLQIGREIIIDGFLKHPKLFVPETKELEGN